MCVRNRSVMHRLKSFSAVRHSLQKNGFLSRYISTSAQPYFSQYDDDVQDQVLVEGRGISRAAVLNRPSELNALTTSMVARLRRLYESWEENSDIGFVILKSNGRAFSSGGDVVNTYHLLQEGKAEECKAHFATIYNFVYLLGTYLKPNVAIMNGITMGGGACIGFPAMFRVITEKTMFSTPEVQLGFHPDSGASFYLSRLPGYLGEYLALTGEKLNGVEMIACGLATHHILTQYRLGYIEERLAQLMTDDPSVIENSLSQYGELLYPDKKSILKKINRIDACFSQDTVEEIVEALGSVLQCLQQCLAENEVAASREEWCTSALKKLKEASPLSLKVTLQSIREGRFQPLDQCLAREYRTSLTYITKQVSNDFSEGVRARLIDKDFAPKWDPPTLQDVTKDMVNYHFAPLGESEPELNLPTATREPSF